MFQRDHIMRQVQQAAQVVARVAGLKEDGRYEEAMDEIARALNELAGLDATPTRALSTDALIDLCTSETGFSARRALALADLLRQAGDILALQDDPDDARTSYRQALALYRKVLDVPDAPVPWDIGSTIAELEELVEDSLDEKDTRG